MARGGWFRTGDLATVDGDGWLCVVGRLDDVIIRGGENVSAVEVAGVLEAHPDVDQAVAVAYPDPLMGERVAAVVVAPASFDLDACRRWFSARGLARYKTPERLVRLPALPTLASGKVDRGRPWWPWWPALSGSLRRRRARRPRGRCRRRRWPPPPRRAGPGRGATSEASAATTTWAASTSKCRRRASRASERPKPSVPSEVNGRATQRATWSGTARM